MRLFTETDFKPDFYRRLGLAQDATRPEIYAAYRRLAKRTHPDLNPGDADATKKFIGISKAYDCLYDPGKRKVYDAELNKRAPAAHFLRSAYARSDAILLKRPANTQKPRPRARTSWHETQIQTPVFRWPEYTEQELRRYYKSLEQLEKGLARGNDLKFLADYTDKPLPDQAGNAAQQRQIRRTLPASIFEMDKPRF